MNFKLEFNEDQQSFHHNYGHNPDVAGWEVIAYDCTDDQWHHFQNYLNENNVNPPYKIKDLQEWWAEFIVLVY